jgi:hypothetical protein
VPGRPWPAAGPAVGGASGSASNTRAAREMLARARWRWTRAAVLWGVGAAGLGPGAEPPRGDGAVRWPRGRRPKSPGGGRQQSHFRGRRSRYLSIWHRAERSESVAESRYGVKTLRPPSLQETQTLSMRRGSCCAEACKRFFFKLFNSLSGLHS